MDHNWSSIYKVLQTRNYSVSYNNSTLWACVQSNASPHYLLYDQREEQFYKMHWYNHGRQTVASPHQYWWPAEVCLLDKILRAWAMRAAWGAVSTLSRSYITNSHFTFPPQGQVIDVFSSHLVRILLAEQENCQTCKARKHNFKLWIKTHFNLVKASKKFECAISQR